MPCCVALCSPGFFGGRWGILRTAESPRAAPQAGVAEAFGSGAGLARKLPSEWWPRLPARHIPVTTASSSVLDRALALPDAPALCRHCGDACAADGVRTAAGTFCCNGCASVFALLAGARADPVLCVRSRRGCVPAHGQCPRRGSVCGARRSRRRHPVRRRPRWHLQPRDVLGALAALRIVPVAARATVALRRGHRPQRSRPDAPDGPGRLPAGSDDAAGGGGATRVVGVRADRGQRTLGRPHAVRRGATCTSSWGSPASPSAT